jgi:hypothetical protein
MVQKQPMNFRAPLVARRFVFFLFAIATAATAAMGLYELGHDEMGIAPHAIMIASFGAAGFLITVYVAMTFMRNTR